MLVGSGGAVGGGLGGGGGGAISGVTFKYWMQVHVFPPVRSLLQY